MGKTQKIKRLISYYFESRLKKAKIDRATNNTVIVNVHYPLKFRFYYRLLNLFKLNGLDIFIYLPTNKSIYNFARLDWGFELLPHVKLISRIPDRLSSAIYCSDRQDQIWSRIWQKKIFLEFDLEKSYKEIINPVFIPYSVHPTIHYHMWREREGLLTNQKNIRLFFSGAYKGYEGRNISKILGKMERKEIIDIYRSHPNTVTISCQNQLDEILRTLPSRKFVFVDQDQFRVAPSQWLKVLSQVEVFLCPPGVVSVMSHNAYEAMAMRAIPFINYPEWFHPHLIDQENSFVFSDKKNFVGNLDRLVDYPGQKLSTMRNNLQNYYDVYQSDSFIINKLQELEKQQIISFIMNIEQEITHELQPESIAISNELS